MSGFCPEPPHLITHTLAPIVVQNSSENWPFILIVGCNSSVLNHHSYFNYTKCDSDECDPMNRVVHTVAHKYITKENPGSNKRTNVAIIGACLI